MAVQDKFADEMLTDEQLDGVAGGTRLETALVNSFFSQYIQGKNLPIDITNANTNLLQKEVLGQLLDYYFKGKMTYNIDVGENGTGVGEGANEYYFNGQKLDTTALLSAINNAIVEKQNSSL